MTRKGPGLRQRTRAYGGCAGSSVHHDDDPAPVTQRGCGSRLFHLQNENGSVIDRAECCVIMCIVEKDFEPAPIGHGADQSYPWVCQRSAPRQNRSHADQERPFPNFAMAAQYRLLLSPVSSGAQRQQRPTVSWRAGPSIYPGSSLSERDRSLWRSQCAECNSAFGGSSGSSGFEFTATGGLFNEGNLGRL